MVSTTCHKDMNRNIIQMHTYFSRSEENNVPYLHLTPSNYCWASLMVSFNFVYWQWRVMSSKQQFSKESRAQFNKPISFLTYKLNWIFCRLQKARVPEPTYPQGKPTATLNMWRKNQGAEYVNQIVAPEYVNHIPIPTPEYVNAWVDHS